MSYENRLPVFEAGLLVVYVGSYKTQYYGADSDIDIAYLSARSLSSIQKANLLQNLVLMHRKNEIDRVDLRSAGPVLR